MDTDLLNQKSEALSAVLRKYGQMIVAFSGGVDSSFLLTAANEVLLGKNQLIAVTAVSAVHPQQEIEFAKSFTAERGIEHMILYSEEMNSPEFLSNPPNRCYVCKKIIFSPILDLAGRLGIKHVAHGANLDDLKEFRPGLQAAEEMGIIAPLVEAGLNKSDIRFLSRNKSLPTWDKPSSGCLATRIPYGRKITEKNLKMVETAEQVLSDLGFSCCRVRFYDELAKIEVLQEDFIKFMDPPLRSKIISRFNDIGFLYITIDIEGYQSGRLNRSLLSSRISLA